MTGSTEDPSEALEDLLVEALERLERDGPAGVERLLAAHPARASRVRTHLERIHRMGLAGSGTGAEPATMPERLGEFRVLGALGHGGMGVVYRALQESLGREVALKLVRPEQLLFPGARERFRREVELVARMQHPGIVPVHAVGSEGGVPYFAMELVHGLTLAEVIEDFGGRDPRRLSGRDLDEALARRLGEAPADEPAALFEGSWTEVVLRILREVAEALEHAHRRGVLHRDVKPSNVMVTRAGRVLLLDFGLAGAQEGERMTRTGARLGSLAYMAPELLSGEARELDARCDVYALGATGWELLALRLPYQSSDPLRLRELSGAATRPRLAALNPAVGWEVETVLATALEPDPARRYAGAAQLARDLDNVLAHRPIEARDPGPWLRLRRWTQRHPARATGVAATALLLSGGPILYAWQEARARRTIEAQRDELAAANTEIEAARARTERHFHAALDAIGRVLASTASRDLRNLPRLQRARLGAIERAQELLTALETDRPEDRTLRIERARLSTARAEVLYDQGRLDEALAGCRAAHALLGGAAREPTAAGAWRDTLWLEATLLQASLRWCEALTLQRELEAGLRESLEASPADDTLRYLLARCLGDAGLSLKHCQGAAQSRPVLAEAHALTRELAASHPEDADQVGILARVAYDRAEVELACEAPDVAAALAREAVASYRAAAELEPEERMLSAGIALGLARLGKVEHARGGDAEPSYREALAILERLALDYPEVARYRLERARSLDELAVALRFSAPERAAPLHREALAQFDALLAEEPDGCQLRATVATALNNWANHLVHAARDFDQALAVCERGTALLEPCRRRSEEDLELDELSARLAYFHALALCLADDPDRARAEIEAYTQRADSNPRRWRFAADLWCEWTLAWRRSGPEGSLRDDLEAEGRERLLAALRRAVELGYRDLEELRTTPALQSFQDDPELAELLTRIDSGR